MSTGRWRPRAEPPDYADHRRRLAVALERHAAEALGRAQALEEAAARERTTAVQLGRLATQYGGVPPRRLAHMARTEDEAA